MFMQRLFKTTQSISKRAFSKVNSFYEPYKPEPITHIQRDNTYNPKLNEIHNQKEWSLDQINKSTEDHLVFAWGPTDGARAGAIPVKRGEGIYLYGFDDKKYIDLSS